jgi:uncharacterized membrane protein SirB2
MFKERIKRTGQIAGYCLISITGAALFIYLISLIPNTPRTNQIGEKLGYIMIYIIFTIFILGIAFIILTFINWLFFQPYLEWRRKRSESK